MSSIISYFFYQKNYQINDIVQVLCHQFRAAIIFFILFNFLYEII